MQKQGHVIDVIRRADRANKGKTPEELYSIIQELELGLTRHQAADHYRKTLKPSNKDLITGAVKAQKTTTERSSAEVAGMRRWHSLVTDWHRRVVEFNTGGAELNSAECEAFMLVMKHFCVNQDEMCLMASDGAIHIVGDKAKKKHELNLDDSRISMTTLRSGSSGGSNGPTVFAIKGEKKPRGFTDAFLVRQGTAPGSTAVMTPTAFMPQEAWDEVTPKMCKRIRQMPFIKDHPNFLVFCSLDGFGPHVKGFNSLQCYHGHNIVVAKKQGGSSQLVQPYDADVAMEDKS